MSSEMGTPPQQSMEADVNPTATSSEGKDSSSPIDTENSQSQQISEAQQKKQDRIVRDIEFSKSDLADQLSAVDADESITDPNAKAEKKNQIQREYQTAQARRITGEQNPTVKNLVAECKKLDILPTFKMSQGTEISQLNMFEKYTESIVQNYTKFITEQLQTDEGKDLALKMLQEKTGKSDEEIQKAIEEGAVSEFIADNFLFEEVIPTFQRLNALMKDHPEEIGQEKDPQKLKDFIAAVDLITDNISEFGEMLGEYVDVIGLIDLVFYGEFSKGGFKHSGKYSSERGNELGEDRTINVLNDVFDEHKPAEEFLGKLLWDSKEEQPEDMWTKKTLDKLDTFFVLEGDQAEGIAQKKEKIAKALLKVESKNISRLDKDQIVLSDKVVDHIFIKFNKLLKRADGQKKQDSTKPDNTTPLPEDNSGTESSESLKAA